jgi:hypothetical protein
MSNQQHMSYEERMAWFLSLPAHAESTDGHEESTDGAEEEEE